jgi:hypothetical protein
VLPLLTSILRDRDFKCGRVAKVLTFAALADIHVLLEILVCKTQAQKFLFAGSIATAESAVTNIGYARVPTLEPNLDLQLQALGKASCVVLAHTQDRCALAAHQRTERSKGVADRLN